MIKIFDLVKLVNIKLALILYVLLISIIASLFFYMPSPDEWNYMHETILISELFNDGLWFGDQFVGTHGFLFKIIPAIIFIFFEPTIYIPYFYHILLNIIALLLVYEIAFHLFQSKKYAFIATFFLINTTLFLQYIILNAYLREAPALFSLSLLFYLVIKHKKFVYILIAIILTIEAKEYIGIGAILSYLIYLIFAHYEKFNKNYTRMTFNLVSKIVSIFVVLFGWLYLMFSTSIIPENHSWSAYLGLDLNSAIYKFEPDADYSLSDSLKKIDSLKKWESNRDSVYRFFDRIKYQNEFKQTINYQNLGEEDFNINIDSSFKLISNDFEKNIDSNIFKIFVDNINKFIIRILSINGFNYSSIPIFIIIIVLIELILIVRLNKNIIEWTLIIVFFLLIFGLYIKSDYIPRYFHPAILPLSFIFTHALRYSFRQRWFVLLVLCISLPLTVGQILINEFTPTFYAAIISQLLFVPLIWLIQERKTRYIYFIFLSLIISFLGYQSVILYKDLKKEHRGDFEYNLRKYSSHFDIDNDSLVYLTHRLYPGRTTNQTIKFYNKSKITLNDEASLVQFISPKVTKYKINKYFKQNLFDIHSITYWKEFPNWNVLKSDYLVKNKINRVVFVIDNYYNFRDLRAVYYKKDYFKINLGNANSKDFDYWKITEYYKNLLFKYRPSWLQLIYKKNWGTNKTIYVFKITENNN